MNRHAPPLRQNVASVNGRNLPAQIRRELSNVWTTASCTAAMLGVLSNFTDLDIAEIISNIYKLISLVSVDAERFRFVVRWQTVVFYSG